MCQILIWYSLYFFVLELVSIKQIIGAEDPSLFSKRRSASRYSHIGLFVGFALYFTGQLYFSIELIYEYSFFITHLVTYQRVLVALKLSVDLLFHALFIYLIVFFIRKKMQSL